MNPNIKKIKDNSLENSVILNPKKIIKVFVNIKIISGKMLSSLNFFDTIWCKCELSGLKIDFFLINLFMLTNKKS